jgi:hypothetical protein
MVQRQENSSWNLLMSDPDRIIEDLILSGALEVAGLDIETGEALYNFTDKLKDINPKLHNEQSKYFAVETMALWEYGFLSMDVTEPNPIVSLTDKSFDQKEIAKLDKQHQYTLKEIIRIILNKEK